MLRPRPFAREVLVALLTIGMLRTVGIVLVEAFLGGKVDVAIRAYPMALRVLCVLLVSSIVRKPPIAAIAVGHRLCSGRFGGTSGGESPARSCRLDPTDITIAPFIYTMEVFSFRLTVLYPTPVGTQLHKYPICGLHFCASSSPSHVPEIEVRVWQHQNRAPNLMPVSSRRLSMAMCKAVRLPYLTSHHHIPHFSCRCPTTDQLLTSYIRLFNSRYELPFPILDLPIPL